MIYRFGKGVKVNNEVKVLAICQILISDFLYGWGRFDQGEKLYSDDDLREALEFGRWLLSEDLIPIYEYEPRDLIRWCCEKLGQDVN